MQKILNRLTFINVLQQLIHTFKQSLAYAIKGRFFKAYYWFLVSNIVSLYGNRVGSVNRHNSYLTLPLRKDGFMELNKLPKKTIEGLVEYFLKSQKEQYESLNDYFDKKRLKNFVRSDEIDIRFNNDLIKTLLTKLKIVPLVSEYLGLPKNEILAIARMDALFRIDGEREFRGRNDDALEFHRDIDSFKFVKVFIYLVDVDKGFGEHEVCISSHKSIPWSLRTIKRHKYSNLKDKLHYFNLKSVVGKAGYAWIEDTTAFHRGTIPNLGDRLMLSLVFYDKKSATHMYDKSDGLQPI